MKIQIKSADLELYNANSRGNRSPDCVKRAISLAFDISYNDVSKLLNAKSKEMHWEWNRLPVFKKVIEDLGGGKKIEMIEEMTVNDFADNYADPSKIYILLTGQKFGETSHLVALRSGKIWDNWNSKNYYVASYWEIDGSSAKQIRDTDKNYMIEIADTYARPTVHDEMLRYANKKAMKYNYATTQASANKYQIVVNCKIILEKDDLLTKNRSYSFKINLTVEPTLTEPEIIDFIEKVGKQKTYDRMWAINEEEKKLRESAEVMRQQGQEGKPMIMEDDFMTTQEQRFFNSLPGWVKPLVKYINIQSPGKYPDSYVMKINKLPGDNLESHRNKRDYAFETWNADEMRNILNEYKDTGRVEGIDYYYEEEF